MTQPCHVPGLFEVKFFFQGHGPLLIPGVQGRDWPGTSFSASGLVRVVPDHIHTSHVCDQEGGPNVVIFFRESPIETGMLCLSGFPLSLLLEDVALGRLQPCVEGQPAVASRVSRPRLLLGRQ